MPKYQVFLPVRAAFTVDAENQDLAKESAHRLLAAYEQRQSKDAVPFFYEAEGEATARVC